MSYKGTKKLLATIFTSAILAASLCACGNESSSKAVSDNRNVATEITTEAPSEITSEVETEAKTEATTEALEAAFEKDENKDEKKDDNSEKKDEKSDSKTDDPSSSVNQGSKSLDESLENGTLGENSDHTSDYSVATTLDKESVENFASSIQDAVINSDWDTLSQKVNYPIDIDGISVTNNEDFVNLINEKGVSSDFVAAIQADPCKDMFARDLGIMMGNGEIWFTQIADTEELAITGINGMLSDGTETQE